MTETFVTGRISLYLAATALLMPMLMFAVITVISRSRHTLSAFLSIGAVGVSLICASVLLFLHWQTTQPILYETTWLVFGQTTVPFGFLLDPISLLMLVVVAGISMLVQCYSLGYMAGDPGFGRYYGYMSFFSWAMFSLTISSSLLQLYIFWELVGLASYLLIGFWFEDFSASQAGKKAFVMTRLGDVAFLTGVLLLWLHVGNLDFTRLSDPALVRAQMSPAMTTLTALLVFGGIIGKSAQFPLLTWLPDAMQGPTPVSALLHSATMVAAGAYLFCRLFGFFSLSPTAMTVCLAIGAVSMLLASTMAMVARDIKQVWAYSTISQLGYMLMGLGAGNLFAGFFHLMTHAGFKALLFLTAGVFIHHYDTNDVFHIGQRGGRRLRSATICMIVAAGALSGLPPLSGFFSKELILGRLYGLENPIWFCVGIAGVFLTAYYTFRLVMIILFPNKADAVPLKKGLASGSDGAGASTMSVILWVLAIITLVLGLLQAPIEKYAAYALGGGLSMESVHRNWLPAVSILFSVTAILLTWMEYGRKDAARIGFVERLPGLADLFLQRWYIDHFYRWLVDRLIDRGFARWFSWNDKRVIDGAVHGLAGSAAFLGRILARWHLGQIQNRLMAMFTVVIILIIYFRFGAR